MHAHWQIYVEVPRARLTMELAKIKEDAGDIASAASILQELQVYFIDYLTNRALHPPVCDYCTA